MSDHITDEVADYIEGRITPERTRAIESHLASCAECAADVAYAREFQTSAMMQGLMHIRPGRVVALATEPHGATDVESHHLNACDTCRSELDWVKTNSAAMAPTPSTGGGAPAADEPSTRPRSPKPTRSFFRTWGLGLAAAAAAVVIVVIALPDRSRDSDRLTSLARLSPIPVNITRSTPAPGSFEEARLRGLEKYRDGDYAGARTHLEQAIEQRPDDAELRLYLGSASLLLHDYDAAALHLTACIDQTENDALRHEASWQLANAYLAAGRIEEAKNRLQQLRANGAHADRAAELLQHLVN